MLMQQKESELQETNTHLHEAEKNKEKINKEMGNIRQDIDTQKVQSPESVLTLFSSFDLFFFGSCMFILPFYKLRTWLSTSALSVASSFAPAEHCAVGTWHSSCKHFC